MFKSVPDWKNNMDVRQMEEARGLNLPPHPIKGRVAPVDMHKQYIVKRKPEVGRSGAESQNMECPSKKANRGGGGGSRRENMGLALKEEEEDPEEEEEDPDEETEEERLLREAVEEVKPSFPPNSQGSRSIGLSSSQVMNRLQEIVWRSEELERQVNESRQKIAVLEREKAELASLVSKLRRSQNQLKDDIHKRHKEFWSQKWRMEQDNKELIEIRSKLERAAHKAKELTEIITTQDRAQKIK